MAKYALRLEARALRMQGISVKDIANRLHISKSSASIWVRDIILSVEQLEALRKKSLEGAERGREKSAISQKQKWNEKLHKFEEFGKSKIGLLTERELLIAGLALYWGEGSKKSRSVQFCNSDPRLVRFLLLWLKKCFDVAEEDIICVIGINEIHKERDRLLHIYWSRETGIPLQQFRKTSFKKVTNKKVYDNFNTHYGTLSVKVRKPARFYAKIIGLIEGLAFYSRQGSSVG